MKTKPLPDWLYEVLPYFYVAVGLLTIIVLRNGMAVFSGVTLFSAGAAVWMLRYRYRRALAQSARHFSAAESPGTAGSFAPIPWRKAYDSGDPIIDAQHRRIFELGNALINAVSAKQSQADVEWLIDELIDSIDVHFSSEEAGPKWTDPNFKDHQQAHRDLLANGANIRERFRGELTAPAELLDFVARDVILDHLSREALATRPIAAQ